MTRKPAFVAIFLVLMSQPAIASQTLCTFSAGEASRYYELEFIGYGDTNPTIVFSSTEFGSGKPITLNPANYSLKHFDSKTGKVSLEFHDPKSLRLPPSFNLNGTSGRLILSIGSSVIEGDLKCGY